MDMYSENYLNWAKQTKLPPLTGNQREFAEFCLTHYKELIKIGNLESVFIDIRRWIKEGYFNPALAEEWIEILLPVEVEVPIEWPTILHEERFDWKLSMEEIDRKFGNSKVVKHYPKRTFKQPPNLITPPYSNNGAMVNKWDVPTPLAMELETEIKVNHKIKILPNLPLTIEGLIEKLQSESEPNFHEQ